MKLLENEEVLERIVKEHNTSYRRYDSDEAQVEDFIIRSRCDEPFRNRPFHIDNGLSVICSGQLYTWYVESVELDIQYRLEQHIFENSLKKDMVHISPTHW